MDAEVRLLLDLVDEAYDKKAWHGTNFRGSIRGLTAREAAWRPGRGRHNIWEIVVHVAYWKYAARRRILGEKRGSFALKGSNWFPRIGALPDDAWEEDVALLGREHHAMREAISGLRAGMLPRRIRSGGTTHEYLIRGIASHDLYHAGQIQLLKRLMRG
ncbi:MAG: DinB family protein [Bacteroidota bacterium]